MSRNESAMLRGDSLSVPSEPAGSDITCASIATFPKPDDRPCHCQLWVRVTETAARTVNALGMRQHAPMQITLPKVRGARGSPLFEGRAGAQPGTDSRHQGDLGGHGRTPRHGNLSSGGHVRTRRDTRGHATDTVRDREAPGSNPGAPSKIVFKIGLFAELTGGRDHSRITDSRAARPGEAQ